jgi:hypothetical protein
MNSARDQMPPITKFVSPTVANGKVYVPSSANVVVVYGMLPQPAIPHQSRISRIRHSR